MPNILDYIKWRGDLSFKQDDLKNSKFYPDF